MAAKKRLLLIRRVCSKKSLTPEWKGRKMRIMEKLLYTRRKTDLHVNLYLGVLPIFKSFVLIFEQKEPSVHQLFDDNFLCVTGLLEAKQKNY